MGIEMKKIFIWLLFISILALTACKSQETDTGGEAVKIYCLNREETKLIEEEKILGSTSRKKQVEELVTAMKGTADVVTQKMPFGFGFSVNSFRLEENQFVLDVGSSYYKMEPTTEVLVRAAIVRTITQIEGIDHVVMTVDGAPLMDSLGAPVGTMSADQFINNAGDEINTYEKVELNLYFTEEEGKQLVEVKDSVVYSSNISMEKLVVEELIKGPDKDQNASPVINPDTKTISVTAKDGICYVNFDSGFLTQIYNVTGEVAIYSIVNSLVELPNINKVQILVNGESDIIFRETFDLNTMFERNLELTRKTGED